MPLWLEFDGLQIAHACWSEEAMKIVKKRRPTGHLQLEDLEEVAAKTTEFALAVETITSGPEVMEACTLAFWGDVVRSPWTIRW